MANGRANIPQKTKEAMVKIPLSALRYLSRYPREKKIVVEIAMNDIVRVKQAAMLTQLVDDQRRGLPDVEAAK